MHDARLLAEAHGGRSPVDLALGPGRCLETRHGALGEQLGRPQGPDETLDRLVAATVALLTQFLEQVWAEYRTFGPRFVRYSACALSKVSAAAGR